MISNLFSRCTAENLGKTLKDHNIEPYLKIWNHEDYLDLRLKIESKPDEHPKLETKFIILLSSLKNISNHFPHFTKMLNGLIWIYLRANEYPRELEPDRKTSGSESFSSDLKGYVDAIDLNYAKTNFKYQNIEIDPHNMYGNIEKCANLKIIYKSDIFFELRHSQSFSESENIINFESWLNYVKGAQDGTIFNTPYIDENLRRFVSNNVQGELAALLVRVAIN